MKASIEVTDRQEATRIRTALDHPETRALVNVIGALLPLEPADRHRVLVFVGDQFELPQVRSS